VQAKAEAASTAMLEVPVAQGHGSCAETLAGSVTRSKSERVMDGRCDLWTARITPV